MRYRVVRDDLLRQPRRWLVTGAAGFIGSALVEELLGLGQHVVAMDNLSTGHKSNLDNVVSANPTGSARFRFVESDICDFAACQAACEGVDIVLHQAALGSVPRSLADPLRTHNNNANGFLHMITAARDAKVQRFVFASSSSVYGDHPDLPKREENIGKPLSPYAASKRINEIYAQVYTDCFDVSVIGLRYFNVFGRRQDPNGPYAAVIPRWMDHLLAGKACQVFGDGTNSRDFCYIDNVVQANLLAALAPAQAAGTVYNVGCNGNTSLKQLFTILRELLSPHDSTLVDAEPSYGPPRPGDVAHSQAAIGKICAALGYEPSHDVHAGLAETVAWYIATRA